ncbi:DUF3800 domain-containing protein [Sphingomonas sp. H39-1-10]|uniref:DUF3800 domain-containing protein n=1 Tax=Sphingomonas pollutisoli TaxID=3030829 RepID=UPI0023B888D3|nr:DUF3800 domain-containing protein [Sphingomonas pollutisoli]MDF0488176.1 DUF3800 domain-containing protein [Sphingomonas pollutisoli]
MEISIFCDESCHLEHDNQRVMLLGAIWCDRGAVRSISESIRALKREHGLKIPDARSRGFEVKWTKVGPAQLHFYDSLIRLFLEDDRLHFRSIIVRDKNLLDHSAFDQTHDDFYYKLYYRLLLRILEKKNNEYNVYLDIKDTRGGSKTRRLHDFLCTKLRDDQKMVLKHVEQIRSEESELLQLCDLILGAVSYYNRQQDGSEAKLKLIDTLSTYKRRYPRKLGETSFLSEEKFDLFYWSAAA